MGRDRRRREMPDASLCERAEFDAVAAELARSLDVFKVPEPEKGEVLAAFAAHKSEVNAGYTG